MRIQLYNIVYEAKETQSILVIYYCTVQNTQPLNGTLKLATYGPNRTINWKNKNGSCFYESLVFLTCSYGGCIFVFFLKVGISKCFQFWKEYFHTIRYFES